MHRTQQRGACRGTAAATALLALCLAACAVVPAAAVCQRLGPFDIRASLKTNCNEDKARADAVTGCLGKQASLGDAYERVKACSNCPGSNGEAYSLNEFKSASKGEWAWWGGWRGAGWGTVRYC